jgi:hypothetical protein
MNKQSMIEKIRALLAKTTDAGCTEAEAMMAAAKAAALMDKFELSPDDVTAGQATATAADYKRATFEHPIVYCACAVARFTGTTIYKSSRPTYHQTRDLFGNVTMTTEAGKHLKIVGIEHEVEIAGYLLDICYNAMEASAAKALVEENAERARAKESQVFGRERLAWILSYQMGMARRISETLTQMARERAVDVSRQLNMGAGNGKSLQIIRQDLVREWLRENNITLGKSSKERTISNKSGYRAGHAAGAGVRFNGGVGSGQRAVHAIGGR